MIPEEFEELVFPAWTVSQRFTFPLFTPPLQEPLKVDYRSGILAGRQVHEWVVKDKFKRVLVRCKGPYREGFDVLLILACRAHYGEELQGG